MDDEGRVCADANWGQRFENLKWRRYESMMRLHLTCTGVTLNINHWIKPTVFDDVIWRFGAPTNANLPV